MAILGKLDAKALANNVSVTNGNATVTLASGSFLNKATANYIVAGDILSLSGVQYVVKEVTSATTLKLHKAYAGTTGTVTAANAIRRTAPKQVAQYVVGGGDSNTGSLVFLDSDEAVLNENKIRGLTGPGWWVYKTYVDASGSTRHKSECIAPLYVSAAVAGDFTDNPAADVATVINITGQPTNQSTTVASGTATFAVTATAVNTSGVATGTVIYQWQRRTSTTAKWTNISGATSASLALTGLTLASNDYQYRVKLTSTAGAEEVISNTATLTVTA